MTLRGFPDGGAPNYQTAVGTVDVAAATEFVALGFTRLDGRGRVFWADNFRNGLGAYDFAPAVYLAGNRNFVAPVAAELPVAAGANTYMSRVGFYLGEAGNIGFEYAFWNSGGTPGLEYTFRLGYNRPNGADSMAGFRFKCTTGEFQLVSGGFTNYVTLVTLASASGWVPVKVVFNPLTGQYIRMIVGSSVYDASALAAHPVSGLGSGMASWAMANNNTSAGALTGYIGYNVLTVDEP